MRIICTTTAKPTSTRQAAIIKERMAYCCLMVIARLQTSSGHRTIRAEIVYILQEQFLRAALHLPLQAGYRVQGSQSQGRLCSLIHRAEQGDTPVSRRVAASQPW